MELEQMFGVICIFTDADVYVFIRAELRTNK